MNNLQPQGSMISCGRRIVWQVSWLTRAIMFPYIFLEMSLFLDFLSLPSIINRPLRRGGQSLVYSTTQNCSFGLSP